MPAQAFDPDHPDHALLVLVLAGGRIRPRRDLMERPGGPVAALRASAAQARQAGMSEAQYQRLKSPDPVALQRGLHWLAHPGHHLLGCLHPDYPPLLRQVPGPPLALFVDGEPSLLWRPSVAVVGSRAATSAGREHGRHFSHQLAAAGLAIVSGMAAGIDASAHEAALALNGATTVAVVGTGPDIAYPPRHAALRDRIAAHGAIISEHPPGTPALRSHFPSRNRVLAGLSLATLVIEAAERSGALITARLAGEFGREVFAVPGSIHNPLSRGCHRLIREGAGLVEDPAEILAALGPRLGQWAGSLQQQLFEAEQPTFAEANETGPSPNADYNRLWATLGHDPTDMDELVLRTGLTAAQLSSMLLLMELEGRVAVEHGRYLRKSRFLSSTASATQAEGQ